MMLILCSVIMSSGVSKISIKFLVWQYHKPETETRSFSWVTGITILGFLICFTIIKFKNFVNF
ncbi:Uncharacterised protein [Klebsiella michiganensis]|uniref:Uncharacterized protein n=1 Tax=Klebsiella michiganensis TaxID=1134687 RepID=A0A7H4PNX9_9ENTR|nr:Uncharacterised protein [Klebsiella michiganensis]